MLKIRNLIDECKDGRRHDRPLSKINLVVVHRISRAEDRDEALGVEPIPDELLTGPLVAEWFRDVRPFRPGAYTGGETPYALVVRTDGTVDQCARLDDQTPHARCWNASGLGVAFAGDFRARHPTPQQVATAEELLGLLAAAFGAEVKGHTELPGAAEPGKECPGEHFHLDHVRARAQALAEGTTPSNAIEKLREYGLAF